MPFGAEYAGGATRFALWAPACERVEVAIGRNNLRKVAMQRETEGWHRCVVSDLAPGTAYAFAVDAGAPVPDPASRSNPWDAVLAIHSEHLGLGLARQHDQVHPRHRAGLAHPHG